MLNNGNGQESDGGFPMAFESDHVPDVIQGFTKLYHKAIAKQSELNALYAETEA